MISTLNKKRFWIGVASKEHVKLGVAGGFSQLCHGKAQPLKRMAVSEWEPCLREEVMVLPDKLHRSAGPRGLFPGVAETPLFATSPALCCARWCQC